MSIFSTYSTDELASMAKKVKTNKVVEKKSLYSKIPGLERSEEVFEGIKSTPEAASFAAQETLREGVLTPGLHYANQALLNYPRAITEQAGLQYPEAETAAGQVLSKGAGIAGAVQSPILRGIGMAGGVPQSIGKGIGMGALKGGVIGGLYAPRGTNLTDMGARGKQALAGMAIGGIVGGVSSKIRQLLHKRPDKVNEIREGMKKWSGGEVKEYGKMLKQAGKEGEDIDPTDALVWMEKQLIDKGIMNETGKITRTAGIDKADRGLVKSYQKLMGVWEKSGGGKLPAAEVIGAGRDIKAAGGRRVKFKPTEQGRKSSELSQEYIREIKPQIRGDVYDKGQARYAKYKDEFAAVDKQIDTWNSKLQTGKGETFLGKVFRKGDTRKVADIIERETGVNLTEDKIMSIISMPIVRQAAIGGGIIWGIVQGLKKIGKGEQLSVGPGSPKVD